MNIEPEAILDAIDDQLLDMLEEDFDDLNDEDEAEQLACCGCLGPAGRCPIRLWRTDDNDQVLDEWAVCDKCIQRLCAQGKTLHTALIELTRGRGPLDLSLRANRPLFVRQPRTNV